MLTSIPIISPVDIPLTAPQAARLLSPPPVVEDADYTVHDPIAPSLDPARYALDEMEQAAYIAEYHDSEWWRERLAIIRKRLAEG